MSDRPTPETDALDEKLSDFNWDEGYGKLLEHSRKLESERDEAIEKAAAFEQAVQDERNIHMTTIAERDQLKRELQAAHMQIDLDKKSDEERNQLRKVCDELAKVCEDFPSAVGNCETGEHWVPVEHWEEYAEKNNAALSSYNSLPHVIAAKKGNEV